MKPSATDKLLAAGLLTLTVFHTAYHFRVTEQSSATSQTAPCSTANQAPGKQLEVYGQIIQIELEDSVPAEPENRAHTGEVYIALNTEVDCLINAVVDDQEWQSWSHAQQELITLGTSVEIQGQIGSSNGQVVLEVNRPPLLH